MNSLKNKLENILKNKLNLNKKKIYSKNYVEENILDSFNLLLIISEIERNFKIKINMNNFNINNFKNLKEILKYIKKKTNK